MGYQIFLALLLAFHPSILAQEIASGTVTVIESQAVAETNENFICAAIDWWPREKCNYNQCPWGYSSIINLNLSHPLLETAIQAFQRLRIRIGGSLQDQILYDVPSLKSPCHPFFKKADGLFGFSKGCLHMQRWDTVNQFFTKNRVVLTFGINALYGRQKTHGNAWVGAWDPSNTIDLINYTISKGYVVDSWEFGNELCGTGVGASVDPVQYGNDLIKLRSIINQLYDKAESKPTILAPGGFYDRNWFAKMLQVTGPGIVDGLTHHIYNLGPGNDPDLVRKIQNPHLLDNISDTFNDLRGVIEQYGPWASAWVGEAGGAYNNGGHLVSDTFINSFWYLDQLGMSATYNTKVYCRQTLIGGNYGLLDKETLAPNPDFYSALLWDQLMGKDVLAVASDASPLLRSYAHCSKGRTLRAFKTRLTLISCHLIYKKEGITLLFINLSNRTSFILDIRNSASKAAHTEDKKIPVMHILEKASFWTGSKVELEREEYHLTPKDGDLQSRTMVLNGKPLELSDEGDIPRLKPVSVDAKLPIYISPSSIAFIVVPKFDAPVMYSKEELSFYG